MGLFIIQFLLDSQSAEHFLISVLNPAQISSEAVLVQLLVGVLVPQTACILGNLIRQNDLAVVAAELDLEVDQIDV